MNSLTQCLVCAGELADASTPLCEKHKAVPCWACGKAYAQHENQLAGAVPRMPCLGIKSGYGPRLERPTQPQRTAAPLCRQCEQYRTALQAIADNAKDSMPAALLGDIARIALAGARS